MYKSIFFLGAWLFLLSYVDAKTIIYEKADSQKVMRLLQEGREQKQGVNLPLFFAQQLIGIPYVAHTLEVDPREKLVVNLRQLDCTTLVENVVALTLAVRTGNPSFAEFCKQLSRIRYQEGVCNGYASRNHYFSEWIASNERMGIVEEIKGKSKQDYFPFTAQQVLNLYYMSTFPQKYKMLANNPAAVKQIRENEQKVNGETVRYIPRNLLGKERQVLNCVNDGDILAIVTQKKGLDTSHLGFAFWKNGKLHLLHASSVHKKVVFEPMTLLQYMKKNPSQLGVRVVRIR